MIILHTTPETANNDGNGQIAVSMRISDPKIINAIFFIIYSLIFYFMTILIYDICILLLLVSSDKRSSWRTQ